MKHNIMRTLLLITILSTIFSFSICYGMESDNIYPAKFLMSIGVLNGYPDGDLKLDNKISREEFSKIAVLVSPFKSSLDLTSYSSPFPDVLKDRWSAPYVKVAATNGILQGYPDLTFKPTNNIKLEEACVISLRLLGYTSSDYGTNWPYSQIAYATEKELLNNITTKVGQDITRKDAINLIYNTLVSKINNQNIEYISLIDYVRIKEVTLLASNQELPTLATDRILTSVGEYTAKYGVDHEVIGAKGDLILDLNNNAIALVPRNQKIEEHKLLSILTNGIIVTDNGSSRTIEIKKDISAYYKGQKTTLSNLANNVGTDTIIKLFYNQNNELDYVMMLESEYLGPYRITSSNWKNEYGITNEYSFIADGKNIELTDLKINDVIYIYPDIKSVRVYSDIVAGQITDMLPSKENVSTIILNGTSYKVETVSAYLQLQKYEIGDVITVLLGKDGIAFVDTKETTSTQVIGIVLNTGTEVLTNSNGSYSVYYANILDTNGKTQHYTVNKDYSDLINESVKVNVGNEITISKTALSNVYGTVNSLTNKIGTNKVSKNVHIIEVPFVDEKYIPIYKNITLARINGITINKSNVVTYTKNSDNEIDSLIITDVTNDMYNYGVLLSTTESVYTDTTTYTYISNGIKAKGNSTGISFIIKNNSPIAFLNSNGIIYDIIKLTKLDETVKKITTDELITSKGTYALLSNITVYEKDGDNYILSNLNELLDQNITNVSVYYDKLPENGGNIRLLIYS